MPTEYVAPANQGEQDTYLLELLQIALSPLNVAATVIEMIHLNMHPGNLVYLHHHPPVLEVRDKRGELRVRARVQVVDGVGGQAYAVHSFGRVADLSFPLGSHEEAAIRIHGLVRGWRVL
ncbi:hypothetical protein AB0I81_48665 [Nonomuraea sp. NPDC050404]|uniref:hypothetical protein n=1 Tax=Nonomuraea sp. NPDC050404 TaxID=3155783 RepID=UPI0033E0AADA